MMPLEEKTPLVWMTSSGDVSSGMSNVTATSFTIFDQNIYGQMQAFTNQAISAGPLSFFLSSLRFLMVRISSYLDGN